MERLLEQLSRLTASQERMEEELAALRDENAQLRRQLTAQRGGDASWQLPPPLPPTQLVELPSPVAGAQPSAMEEDKAGASDGDCTPRAKRGSRRHA